MTQGGDALSRDVDVEGEGIGSDCLLFYLLLFYPLLFSSLLFFLDHLLAVLLFSSLLSFSLR